MPVVEAVIGKSYRIPCIQVDGFGGVSGGFIPIIAGEHEDAEIIRYPYQHFHVDWRFVSERVFKYYADRGESRVFAHVILREDLHGRPVAIGQPVIKLRKCRRSLPAYPHALAFWNKELATKFACAKLINGTCPHRGVKVSEMMRDGDILTCPGHGLRWNAITGAAVPPPNQPGERNG